MASMTQDTPADINKEDPQILASLLWIGALIVSQLVGMGIAIAAQTFIRAFSGQAVGAPSAVTLMAGMSIGSFLLIYMRRNYIKRHFYPSGNRKYPYGISKKVGLTAFLLVAMTIVFSAAYQALILGEMPMQPELVIFQNAINSGPVGILLVYLAGAILAPLLEEVLFRGQLQTAIQAKIAPEFPRAAIAIALTSAIFASIHFQPLALAPLFIGGCIFGWMRWKTGSLILPVAAHVAMNFFSITLLIVTGEI